MNIREVMQALLDGKKIRAVECSEPSGYLCFEGDILVGMNFHNPSLYNDVEYELYAEPKKKKKLYQLLCRDGKNIMIADRLFENEEQAKEYCLEDFIKLIEPPIEVEI